MKSFKGQDFYEIREKLLIADELFEDPEFPINDSILYYEDEYEAAVDDDDDDDDEYEFYWDLNGKKVKRKKEKKTASRTEKRIKVKKIKKKGAEKAERAWSYKWRRPSEIAEQDPKFSEGNLTRFAAKQGGLGDCWFVASISSLAGNKKFLHRVVCHDNSFDEKYAGIFHFRFWKFGEWVDVVIDDRLPVDNDGDLAYMSSSDGKEFWTPLLEKAYAKFRGGYQNIDGGMMEIAFQNFTGGVTETHDLSEPPDSAIKFFRTKIIKNALIGAAVLEDNSNSDQLPSGHAYTITGATKYKNTPLVRVRNPWGDDTEWKGAWSDTSDEWKKVPEEFKKTIGFDVKADGEFWMSYRDFIKNFQEVTVCNLSPNENVAEKATKRWEKAQFKGEWIDGITAGGSKDNTDTFHNNPQYLLTVDEPGDEDNDGLNSVIISVLQKENFPQTEYFLKVNFDVFQLEEDANIETRPMGKRFFKNATTYRESKYAPVQEAYTRLELMAGKYLIVPSTKDVGDEGEFLIRIFADNKFKFEEFDNKIETTKVDEKVSKNFMPEKNCKKKFD